MALIIGTGRG